MMHRIANFEKVSKKQFMEDVRKYGLDVLDVAYDEILLPKRATQGSAGYDFYLPMNITLPFGKSIRIPSGIRCSMETGWVLMLFPRSSLGINYQLQLDNTVGVIDADYFQAKNEGHILIQITNHSIKKETLFLQKGTAFVQGVFLPFGITYEDDEQKQRQGGFGSTG